jgi:hypothetical protein
MESRIEPCSELSRRMPLNHHARGVTDERRPSLLLGSLVALSPAVPMTPLKRLLAAAHCLPMRLTATWHGMP